MFGFRIHREGYVSLLITLAFCGVVIFLVNHFAPMWATYIALFLCLILFGLILQFFRNPVRAIEKMDDSIVYAPADGQVVVIEETEEPEYFKDKRLLISVFMNPLNVHANRNSIGGTIDFYRYHPGKKMVAWHPKSSTENERTTVVINNGKTKILLRQIAGSVARRIVCYLKEGQRVEQGSEMGFIKFGSRVDIYLPLDAKLAVKLEEIVVGNKSVIAYL